MKKLLAVFSTLIFFFVCFLRIRRDTHDFKLEKVVFRSPKLSANSPLTILQISDLHNHVFGSDNERFINMVKAANADLIVLTGDLVDKRTMTFDQVFSLIERLTAINEHVYFVSGNHEWENGRTEEFFNSLRKRGVIILNNRNTCITKKHSTINLAGVDDFSTEHENLSGAFSNINKAYYTILLSHAPDIVKQYDTIPADLILSGHTHGGQVRFPLIGALVAPGQGFFPSLNKGTYQLGSNQHLYIDSGVGTTRLPIRFLNQSQLTLITITHE
ncbi:metallophosphoesterase [Lentibacillus salicampi]|uniref:Metallophosphoesterase n=1 Tax=Lentibacillus salicampi TaxID=175306 RepID=A0A4Y9AEB3_9BACI|nr:metallophosphoesterase [Lentibacillus salicampi]TFJ94156.1 metallophosphoesterase [Lentibacillus salicampi]